MMFVFLIDRSAILRRFTAAASSRPSSSTASEATEAAARHFSATYLRQLRRRPLRQSLVVAAMTPVVGPT